MAAVRLRQLPTDFATVHPASVLRAPDDDARAQAREDFLADLATIGDCYRRLGDA